MARLIDGKAARRRRCARASPPQRPQVEARHGVMPGLAAVLVGADPASEIYVRSKGKASREAGLDSLEHRLSAGRSGAGAAGSSSPGSMPIPRSTASWCSCRFPSRSIPCASSPRIDPDEGRRRLPSTECRAPLERRPRPGALHALWRAAAARGAAGRARRRRGGGHRPLQHRGQAHGGAAAAARIAA